MARACEPLVLVVALHEVDLVLLVVALVAQTHVLHMAHILVVEDAVGILSAALIACQSRAAVAPLAVPQILKAVSLGKIFERGHVGCRALRLLQIGVRHGHVALLGVDVRQGEARLQPVPCVAAALHDVIGAAVFGGGTVEAALLLVQTSEVGVTQRDAKLRLRLLVELHREAVVVAGRVYAPVGLEQRPYVGTVDGLSQCAAQRALASQREAQHAVGSFAIVER